MPPNKQRDETIRRQILEWYYEHFTESPSRRVDAKALPDELGVDWNEVSWIGDKMANDVLDTNPMPGNPIGTARITAAGIEELHRDGIPTILDADHRFEILRVLYEDARESGGRRYTGRASLAEDLDIDPEIIDLNVAYMRDKGWIDAAVIGGEGFFAHAKLTRWGSQAYEKYANHGATSPGAARSRSPHQRHFAEGEVNKARTMFRDIVELAETEVVIIDRYARSPLYPLLAKAPDRVRIRVLTSSAVAGDIQQVVQKHKANNDLEVRWLDDSDYDFHDRYIIRDRKDGWAWGHSFHDMGESHHTASGLKPVNRDRVLDDFETVWKNAKEV